MHLRELVIELSKQYPEKLKFHIKRKSHNRIIELEFGHDVFMKELSNGRVTKEKYSPSYQDLVCEDWLVYDREKKGFFPLNVEDSVVNEFEEESIDTQLLTDVHTQPISEDVKRVIDEVNRVTEERYKELSRKVEELEGSVKRLRLFI